ncbi:unnamed protein product [Diamesa tonsa]
MEHNVVKPEQRGPLMMAVKCTKTEHNAMLTKMKNSEREYRKKELFHLKEEPMQIINPEMPRYIEYKCQRCNVANLSYTVMNNWYLEPVDALARKPYEGFINWNKLAYQISELIAFVKGDERKEDKMELLMKQLPQFMTKLAVHPAQIRMLQKLQKTASQIPIVYVMSTDNAIDVIALNFILMKYQLKCPLVMIDKEMESVPGMDEIAEHLKEICVELSKERVLDCLQDVQNMAIVLNKDNDNVLDMLLKASGYGFNTEIYLITVAINHEISNLKLSRNKSNCGLIRVSFNEPYAVQDLIRIKEYEDFHEDLKLTDRMSQHLKYDLTLRHPIMCTNVVAYLLLNQFRHGTTVYELAIAVKKFRETYVKLDYNFIGEFYNIVYHAVRLFGIDVMILKEESIKINQNFGNLMHLYGYSKMLLPHFVMGAILVTCADYFMKLEGSVDYYKVLETAKQLSCLLSFEFLLVKPCQEIDTSLSDALDTLINNGLMTKPQVEYTEDEMQARKLAYHYEESNCSSDDEYGTEQKYTYNKEDEIFINELRNDEWQELLGLLKPLLWNYLTVAECLTELIEAEPIPENDFIETCHQQLLKHYESGKCIYGESLSKESMKNYLKFLEQKNVVDGDYEMDDVEKKTRKIWLTDEFNDQTKIKTLIKDVKRFMV